MSILRLFEFIYMRVVLACQLEVQCIPAGPTDQLSYGANMDSPCVQVSQWLTGLKQNVPCAPRYAQVFLVNNINGACLLDVSLII